MMPLQPRPWVFALALSACAPGSVTIDTTDPGTIVTTPVPDVPPPGTGWTDAPYATWSQPDPEPDWSAYDGAWARIVSPMPGAVVPWEEMQHYEVIVRNPAGDELEPDAVFWQSSADPDFTGDEASFDSDTLELGTHDLTVLVDLPNGSRVAHSVSGVKVQSLYAGTYAGLFSVDGTVNNITVTCTGAALVDLGAQGVIGTGEADCLVSLLGIDVPMTWLFDLENVDGEVTGTGGVDLLGFFTYDIPVTGGSVDPEGAGLQVDFAGPIPFVGELSAFLDAPRVAL
jgi:hypothetical protein